MTQTLYKIVNSFAVTNINLLTTTPFLFLAARRGLECVIQTERITNRNMEVPAAERGKLFHNYNYCTTQETCSHIFTDSLALNVIKIVGDMLINC